MNKFGAENSNGAGPTGLGLSMVYGLASQSGGIARISSQLGAGTMVELWLPMAERIAADQPVPATPVEMARACRILLVDDDPLVAESTVAMLDDRRSRHPAAGKAVSYGKA